jgi:hypothetical protein
VRAGPDEQRRDHGSVLGVEDRQFAPVAVDDPDAPFAAVVSLATIVAVVAAVDGGSRGIADSVGDTRGDDGPRP